MVEERASHARRRPAPALRSSVTAYVGFDLHGFADGVHLGTPSRTLTMVVSLAEPLCVEPVDADGPTALRRSTVVGGLTSRSVALRHRGGFHGIKVGLTPDGARTVFGMPASELADRLVTSDDVLGPLAVELRDRLNGEASWAGRFGAVDAILLRAARRVAGRTRRADGMRPEVAESWRRLVAARGLLPVGALAADLGWSRRHLGERFRSEVGLTPKTFARVVRFDHAHALAAAHEAPRWAEISAACGYADQAHLVRDWRAFTGRTPTSWRRDEVITGAAA